MTTMTTKNAKPLVWTIAASDSVGGAGIQADIKTFADLGVHGCSVLTAVTAQNSQGVHAVECVSEEMFQQQLQSLSEDVLPLAIKIGVLPSVQSIKTLQTFLETNNSFVVLDTVLSPSQGKTFSEQDISNQLSLLFPLCDLITPNIPEAEKLIGFAITDVESQRLAAEKLLEKGAKAVLLKGGHGKEDYCQDYFLSNTESFWLTQNKQNNPNTHGTGCTLSSAISAFVAHGKPLRDAVVLANAYVSKGIRCAASLDESGHHKGCVTQTGWPDDLSDFPQVSIQAIAIDYPMMPACDSFQLGLYPVVDSIGWLEKLLPLGVKTIQLRIKDKSQQELESLVERAAALGRQYKARLFINDYWKLAIKYQAYGVHLGQEDMQDADVQAIREAGLRLGISTHGEYEFSYAATFKPSYLAIGAIFPTDTKEVVEVGLDSLYRWSGVLTRHYPLVAIGGIHLDNIEQVLQSEVGSVAVVSAITKAQDYSVAVKNLAAIIDKGKVDG